MKKFLLSLAVATMAVSASAAEYTIFDIANPGTWETNANGGFSNSVTVDGKKFDLSTAKAASTTELISPVANSYAWRVYKSSEFTINSADVNMKTITIVYDDYENNKYAVALDCSAGWTGTLSGTTFNIQNAAGANTITCTAATAQARIKTITVSDEVTTPPAPVDPTPGEGDMITIFDIANPGTWTANSVAGFTTNVTAGGKNFTIETAQAGSTTELISPVANTYAWRVYKGSQFTITSSDMTMKTVTIVFDNYENNKYAVALDCSTGWTGTLNDVTFNITNAAGATTITCTSATAQARIKTIAVSDEVVTPGGDTPVNPGTSTVVKSVKEAIALASDTKVTVDFPLTVAFVSFKNVFAADANGDFIQIYGENSYEANDIIPAGWEATYKLYNDVTPEFMPVSLPAASGKGAFDPKSIVDPAEVTVALVNSVVKLKNVVFDAATPDAKENFPGKMDGTELSFRNNYEIAGVAAGTYDVKVVVTVYQGVPSLYVIEYMDATAVEAIEAVDAEAVYYNLMGAKVANPENGIFVKVCGNKAEKVVIR